MCATDPVTPRAPLNVDGFDAALLDKLFVIFAGHERIALAVSGGADSTALMLLARRWLGTRPGKPPQLTVLTVDHGLRAEAADEARHVGVLAAQFGFPHATLKWTGTKPRSNIQAAARKARYALMASYCLEQSIPALATAHTQDDQAETLLMRLARGSGVDGLSAMAPVTCIGRVALLRPLLDVSRLRLEDVLRSAGIGWIDDPTNSNEHYERVRVRRALAAAGELGLTAEALALSATRLNRARDALERATDALMRAALSLDAAGLASIPVAALHQADDEIGIRALHRLTIALGGRETPVRLRHLEAAWTQLRNEPRSFTLGGCQFAQRNDQMIVTREFGRMPREAVPLRQGMIWDRRFRIETEADLPPGVTLRPLGPDGLAAAKSAKLSFPGRPRAALVSLPSLWRDGRIIYAPFAVAEAAPPTGWLACVTAEFANEPLLLGE